MLIELDETVLSDASPEQVRLEFAIWLYTSGRATKAQARRLITLGRLEFEHELGRRGLGTELTEEHLEQDLASLRALPRR
jgi:predicted HTH domain antitoxin